MGFVRHFFDGLTNVFTGLGSSSDPRRGNRYCFTPLDRTQIEAAYRGSGLMRKCIDIPAFDSVREWRDWQADAKQIEAIEAEEKRLGVQAKVLLAEILRGLGGGAILIGAPGEPSQPLPANLGKGQLAYLHVVNRWQITASGWEDDPRLPGFGGPKLWRISAASGGQVDIHPSRVICFRGDPVPNLAGISNDDAFWGDSRIARIMDAVQNSDTAQAAFASLISKARSTIVGIPGLSDLVSTEGGEQRLQARLSAMTLGESMFNVILRDAGDGSQGAGETIDHRQVNWAGIRDVIIVFAEAVAAAADIPMTRLWGKSAEGMNASGDSQQRDYHKQIRAKQELDTRPCLEQLDAALVPSALGTVPPDVWFKFAPLDTPSEKEETDRFKTWSEAVAKVVDTGTVPEQAMAEAVQNTMVESGFLVGLDTALEKIPEDERWGLNAGAGDDDLDPNALQAANSGAGLDPGGSGIQRLALNGAQIKSLLELIQSVESGLIDVETATAVIRVAFPTLTAEEVRALLKNAGDDPVAYLAKLGVAKRGSMSVAANENGIEQLQQRGAINADQARALLTDARPRSLYVQRKLLNAAEFSKWAKEQGFETTTPADELHVTITFSRTPVDWMKMGSDHWGSPDGDGKLTVPAGGARIVEPLGDKGAVVLLFSSSQLSWRHEDMKRNGASFDFEQYQPHVTITYQRPEGLDLSKVEPFAGKLVFGPEIFSEIVEDWERGLVET